MTRNTKYLDLKNSVSGASSFLQCLCTSPQLHGVRPPHYPRSPVQESQIRLSRAPMPCCFSKQDPESLSQAPGPLTPASGDCTVLYRDELWHYCCCALIVGSGVWHCHLKAPYPHPTLFAPAQLTPKSPFSNRNFPPAPLEETCTGMFVYRQRGPHGIKEGTARASVADGEPQLVEGDSQPGPGEAN